MIEKCVKSLVLPIVVALVLLADPYSALAQGFTVTDIGTLTPPGVGYSATSTAQKINNAGQVVGSSYHYKRVKVGRWYRTYQQDRAVLWQNGTLTSIATPVSAGTIGISRAVDINDAGQVVGSFMTPSMQAFVWQDGTLTGLGSLTYQWSEAKAINAAGEIVANFTSPGWTSKEAFVWRNGAWSGFGYVSEAVDIDSAGQIIGFDVDEADVEHQGWGILPATEHSTYIGGRNLTAMNDRGQVVGTTWILWPAGMQGFVWQDGQATLLDTGGCINSLPNDINEAGMIVGTCDGRAAMWVGTQLVELNALIPADSGWVLKSANGINDLGQIVGDGLHDGQAHGFVLTPAN